MFATMHQIEFLTRILSDPMPNGKVDGLFLFSQTTDNEAAVLESGVALYHLGIVNRLLIMDCPAMNGFPGIKQWRSHITNHGVPDNAVENVENIEKGNLHTLIEARSLVHHAIKNDYKRIILMSSAFHQVRCFLTSVTALKIVGGYLAFYSQPGKPLDWNQTVVHSQGNLTKSRKDLIYTEFERIEKYQAQGDLLSCQAGIEYLDQRKEFSNF